jgi:protein-tyrosine phosphatase
LTDLHNHLLPGVDDGARDVEEAVAAYERMRQAGIERFVATPHLDGSLTMRDGLAARLDAFDRARADLQAALGADAASIAGGAEVKLDVPEVDLSDPRVRLGGTRHVLVEFPFMSVPPQSARALARIRESGWAPVVAHPERYGGAAGAMKTMVAWREAGASLQINSGSLLGRFGDEARGVALQLLEAGMADLLASDYHCRGRFASAEAGELLRRLGGGEQAALLLCVNPGRILDGKAPLAVPPLKGRRGLWSRITHVFR